MRKYIIALIVFVFNLSAFGQEVPKVIPPSPETATILQHSPVNVSLYTGTPNISVPFYTISHGGVEVPISLSYNSDGIRVENIASWAGLGWSLNAGGLVSRTINKLPDDASIGYMNTTYTIEDFLTRNEDATLNSSRQFQLWTILGDEEYRDYEPDTFTFSFLNYSGQFYYNQEEGEFNQAPLTNLRIETIKNSGIIQGFIITDEVGVKYHFGVSKDGNRTARERLVDAKTKMTTYEGIFESDPPFSIGAMDCYQSWMLLDIEFPTFSQMIEFDYSTETNVETFVLVNEDFIKGYIANCEKTSLNYMTKIFNQPKIASINFPTGKIVFEKDTTERLDLNNSFALKSMQLLDNSDVIIKKMQLHTSYMESLPVNANIFPVFLNSLEGAYRLRLDSLSIQDRHSETNGKYLFEYDTQKLPNRYSKSVDYFGYYNGKNNTSFLPKTFFTPPQSQNPNLFSFQIGSANRSVNPDFTQASVLKKIIYPTGGYDEFTWENNFVGQFSGNDTSYRDNLIDKNDFYFTNDINLPDVTLQGSTYVKNLTIPPNVEGFIEFNITMTGCTTLPNLNNDDCHFELTIRGITDPDFLYHIHQTNFNIKAIDLPAGDYKIMAKSRVTIVDPNQQTGGGPLSMFGISVKWSYDPNPNERIYSGLRIKKIETFDREDALAFSKSYDYQYLDTTNNIYKSSGHAINFIDVLDENYFVGCTIVPHPHTTSTIGMGYKLTARSQAPMEFTKGSLVGYTKVKEIFDGGLKGYKEYTYSFVDKYIPTITVQQDALNLNYYAPVSGLVRITENFKRQVYCDWLRGNVKNEETFSSSNLKLKSKMHDYEVVNTKTVPYFGIETIRNDPFPVVGTMMNPCPCDNIRAEFYSSVTEHHRLKRVTETNYFDNGTNGVTLTKEYAYNALSQMSEERVFDNNQLDKTTKYYYPSDASMSGKPCVSQLIAKHMIGLPLVTETYRDTEKLSTQETVYKNWGTTNNPLLLPEVVNTSKGGGVSETRLRYQAYDSQGNPTQVRAEQGLITSYIWGYNKTQPIAKLDNATNTQIANTLGIPFQDINESHLSVINNLRSNGPYFNVPITTLTYKPLVGVTSVTDPKGQTTTYEYDSFGRLERVKDHQGNILSENEYHYRTQN